jgi:hypothetical protein
MFPTAPIWIDDTKLKQGVIGADWIVELEGELIEESSTIIKFRRNCFGVNKPYKCYKFIPGTLEHTSEGLRYADKDGNLRLITKACKPHVILSKERIHVVI